MKLNLRSIDLNLLPVFTAVVEEGQLSRAAERLGMSQPAVSAALQRLRLSVDDALFIRSRSGLTPTPRAQVLYQQVNNGLQTLIEALDPGQVFNPAHSERVLRLIAVDYFETLVLGSLIREMRRHSQTLGMEVLPQQEGWQRQLLNAEVDMALDSQLPEDERITGEKVSEEELVVVARRGHPLIKGKLDLEDFLQAEHVVLPLRERRILPLDEILGRPGWRRRIGAHVSQYGNLLAVASQTDMIATVPKRLALMQEKSLKLQVLDFPVPAAAVPIYLMWPKALDKDPAHRWFRGLLQETFRHLDRA
ncbi:MAG: LysR family transcriptional regulator [Pedobacter sp.]|nr:LysR family transcriptional regulator [Pedobacter sp.]